MTPAPLPSEEFALLPENTVDAGLPWSGPPEVRREFADVGGGRMVSALVWGHGGCWLVLLHGGGQNAHTWDTVALALGRPLIAIDLPGHGHSDWRPDHDYSPASLADDLAVALHRWGAGVAPAAVVGMSLGGLAALSLTERHPELVSRLVLVDITPGVGSARAEPILRGLSGPECFPTFQEMLERTTALNPGRSLSSLRRGVSHNARQLPDGSWRWRWDPLALRQGDVSSMWPAVDRLGVPTMLIRGSRSTVVADDDVAEFRRRRPTALVVAIDDAGHSVQGDQPVALARVLGGFLG